MIVGVTGTERGATVPQLDILHQFLLLPDVTQVHHGDCIGVDYQADSITFEQTSAEIIIHPPLDPKMRAYCVELLGTRPRTRVLEEKRYLVRDKNIVKACDRLIAVPYEFEEHTRSGTWATVRYGRQSRREVVIIWPDGSVTAEDL